MACKMAKLRAECQGAWELASLHPQLVVWQAQTHQNLCSQPCRYIRQESLVLHWSLDLVSWHRRSYSAAPDTNTWWKIFGMRLRAYQAGEGELARRVELDRLCEKTRRYAAWQCYDWHLRWGSGGAAGCRRPIPFITGVCAARPSGRGRCTIAKDSRFRLSCFRGAPAAPSCTAAATASAAMVTCPTPCTDTACDATALCAAERSALAAELEYCEVGASRPQTKGGHNPANRSNPTHGSRQRNISSVTHLRAGVVH